MTQKEKQMAAETASSEGTDEETPAGASFHDMLEWHGIQWYRTERNVCRLQARIVKATQEKRWGKVKALQRLLTHSFSGKALAVRRVTENQGKKTPGVDKVIWDTPEKKAQALHDLKPRGYHPQPHRRVSIPKSNGAPRPLAIPRWAAHCLPFQAMFGIPLLFLLVDRNIRSTIIVLLYHKLARILSVSLLPLSFDRLTQSCNDLRRERNPAWPQRQRANTLQTPSFTPLSNGRNIHIEQLGCGFCRVASISPLSSWCSFRTFWTSSRNAIRIENPLDFAGRQRASHPGLLSFLIEH